jgi:hypothetical protein
VSLVGEGGFLLPCVYGRGIHIEGGVLEGVPLVNGSNEVGIDLFECCQEIRQRRNSCRALDRCMVRVEVSEMAEDRGGGRDRTVSILSPTLSPVAPSSPAHGARSAAVHCRSLHRLQGGEGSSTEFPSGKIEEDKGHDDLRISSSPVF